MATNISRAPQLDAAQKSLLDFLGRVPGLKTHSAVQTPPSINRTYQPDLILDITLPEDRADSPTWRLVVEVIRHSYPSILESATAMLHRYVDQAEPMQDVTMTPVLFAPYLSPMAIGRCTKAGVNCADMAGNGRIVLGSRVYIECMGQPDPRGRQGTTALLFVPKAERVLRVLLNAAGAVHRTWRIQPLAAEAGVSLGQVARVKGALHERGIITEDSTVRHQGGFRLTRPEELLQEWAAAVCTKRYRIGVDHTYNAVDSVMELKRMLQRNLLNHKETVALSGLLAAERYAPYVVSPRFTAYVVEKENATLGLLEEALDLEPVDSGSNVVLTVPRDEGVLYLPGDIKADLGDDVQAVSPVQTYLDLRRLGGRANEGAQHLLEMYLRPRWQLATKE